MLNSWKNLILVGAAALLAGLVAFPLGAQLAATPPMGWNSWDAYAMSIDEKDFKANAGVLAGMKGIGWQYAVIDEGWYLEEPLAGKTELEKFVYDGNGRLIPALNRFPSAADGAGLKPLADWVHGQGLKFGIHLIRGIPRDSVKADKPIAGSGFKAAEAADTSDVCPWNEDNYGIRDNAAGQAWYDSMIGLYAGWGIDYLKVDCISDRPYKGSEIRQIAAAIRKSGRPIVLSLSPGPTSLQHAEEVAKYAQLWRISDDHWDVWHQDHKDAGGSGEFPFGTKDAFDRLAAWQPHAGAGHWPDEDMLPLGSLEPHPGWGKPRPSRLTHEEERTEFTLWAIARSPLILGANLTRLDDFTRSLITNRDVIAVSQGAASSRPLKELPPGFDGVRAWVAEAAAGAHYLALFNLNDKAVRLKAPLGAFESMPKSAASVKELWSGKEMGSTREVSVTLEPHACAIYRVMAKR